MKQKISLQNQFTLAYALFICIALGILIAVINISSGIIFNNLIKKNIAEKSIEIVNTVSSQYNFENLTFNTAAIEAVGMYFVHEGYIVTVYDIAENIVWDARSCNMQQCVDVLNRITSRMEQQFSVQGAMQEQDYQLEENGIVFGTVTIETYSPFFYNEAETKFLTLRGRILFAAGIIIILVSIVISTALSKAISKPIIKAGEAARTIAKIYAQKIKTEILPVKIDEHYRTKELAELSMSINELARELQDAENRQKQLISDISHELRTPLACLQANIEAMLDGIYKPDARHLQSCYEEIIRLANLVNDLNTLNSLEWENIELTKSDFDLAKLLKTTAEQFEPAANEKGIAVQLNLAKSIINADYDRIKQVFINLLSNAVKYTDAGTVTISIEKSENCTIVTVADTGIGIPEKDLPHIFERLYRSDKSRSRLTGGFGIGLTIAAAIIAAHRGSISVKSSANGTVFCVQL